MSENEDLQNNIRSRFIAAIDALPGAQIEIANNLQMLSTNISSMRRGERFPTLANCSQLCTKYNISAQWLLQGKGKMKV